MADFRRFLTVLAVLAVMASIAGAQVGVATPGGSSGNALICTTTGAGIPQLRPEGYTELVGDILITCQGGPNLAVGANIPVTNITIYIAPGVPITSRFFSSNGASDVLLTIDEPGSTVNTGATGGFGPQAPQSLCTYAQQQATSSTGGPGPCNVIVGKDVSGNYAVSVPGPGNASSTGTAQNVYQGKVGDFGVNTVTFYNVPVLPPATGGVTRVYRITNIRVPIPGGVVSGPLTALVSTNPNQVLPVTGATINIGVVGNPTTMAVKTSANVPFQQCRPQTVALTANLIFTEGFATAFKTRVIPGGAANNIPGNSTGNTTWAGEALNTAAPSNQNIPGGLYGNFGAGSESGFIFPQLAGTIGQGTYTAGLADYGTRLKAVFYNIPAGISLYVSTTSATVATAAQATFVPGGTSLLPYAVLVGTNTGEATSDGTAFKPIAPTTTGSDNLGAIQIVPISSAPNSATAVWEVVNENPSATDVIITSVYITYTPSSATTTNPYGLPITDLPLGSPLNDVQLSFAPEPSQGAFTTANSTQGQTPIPRFAVIKTQEGRFTTINLCQTTLLYPYVTGAAGFDTGIAVANTSADPFGTVNQTGSCALYAYGVTVGASGTTPFAPPPKGGTVPGCDLISNPVAGTNCFPVVPAGQVMSVQASTTLTNFQGYVIAICNFQYAHGYAAVTDLGLRNLWSSYLALELDPLPSGVPVGTPGYSPRAGVQSIETLMH